MRRVSDLRQNFSLEHECFSLKYFTLSITASYFAGSVNDPDSNNSLVTVHGMLVPSSVSTLRRLDLESSAIRITLYFLKTWKTSISLRAGYSSCPMLRFRSWALIPVPSGHTQLKDFPDSRSKTNKNGYRRTASPVANSFNFPMCHSTSVMLQKITVNP